MAGFQEVFKRKEIKYLLSKEQYTELRKRLKGIAEVDSYGETDILNIYFDTDDFKLIRTSLEKPLYKEKLRLRSYGKARDDTTSFIEIKKKYKGIVYKRRISAPYKMSYDYLTAKGELNSDNVQIKNEIDSFIEYYPGLAPKMAISYTRIAMAGIKDPQLRLTFDKNIRWRTDDLSLKSGNYGKDILKEGQYLMEVKIANAFPVELSYIFSELGIFPVSYSKYGRGYIEMETEKMLEKAALKTFIISVGDENKVKEKKGEIAYA